MSDTGTPPVLSVQAATLPPMVLRLPPGIHTIEVSLNAEERTATARRLVRDIYPQGDERLWSMMGSLYGAMADELLSDGIAFFGIGLYAIGDGDVVRDDAAPHPDRAHLAARRPGVAHCSLTVAVYDSGEAEPDVVAQGIRAVLLRDPLCEVTWLDLPCGPAVAGTTFRKLVVDGAYTSTGTDEELVMGQIQVHIPFPTGPCTAVITLDTASVEQWHEFSQALGGILGALEFPPPDAGATAQADRPVPATGR